MGDVHFEYAHMPEIEGRDMWENVVHSLLLLIAMCVIMNAPFTNRVSAV